MRRRRAAPVSRTGVAPAMRSGPLSGLQRWRTGARHSLRCRLGVQAGSPIAGSPRSSHACRRTRHASVLTPGAVSDGASAGLGESAQVAPQAATQCPFSGPRASRWVKAQIGSGHASSRAGANGRERLTWRQDDGIMRLSLRRNRRLPYGGRGGLSGPRAGAGGASVMTTEGWTGAVEARRQRCSAS